ncbi:HAMP domain-containing protein [Glycocaulis profundi]|nr:HAMP domain-containing protein [Glycocaulis profundi]
MTLAAAVAGFVAFNGARSALGGVVDEAVPMVSAAQELDAASAAITGELAAFARSTDSVDMTASDARLSALMSQASGAVTSLESAGLDSERVEALSEALADLEAGVDAAEGPTAANLAARDRRVTATRTALAQRAEAADGLEAALDQAEDPATIETLLRAIMAINLVATQYAELDAAETAAQVNTVRDRFDLAAEEVEVNIAILGDEISAAIADQAQAMLGLAEGGQGVFASRLTEISSFNEASEAVEDARISHALLAADVAELVAEAEAQAAQARADGYGAVAFGQVLLTTISAIAVITAALVGWLYVSRNLLARLTRISRVMTALAAGDTSREITDSSRDEIGEMARAVEVFRENAIERQRLESETAAERQEREARARRIEELVQNFENASARALGAVTDAAGEMEMAANALTESSRGASSRTAEVNEAGVNAAQNVDTVAAAAEEMTSSISEIAQQIARSSSIAQSAATQVRDANGDVTTLSEAAGKIDGVVRLINDIAEQTNLLALNATIEAARAGEAGKGFAVVASEVKSLAEQTARATGSISEQISGIQGATGKAVEAIGSIGKVIAEMNEISTAIAAAMEEQRAAAAEITRSAQDAAGGTKRVSESITAVDQAASETGQCAAQVDQASRTLNKEAADLKTAVSRFLEGVRAA